MAKYFVRIKPQSTGYNAVHKENCPFLEDLSKKIYLGDYNTSIEAVVEAKRYFRYSKGCSFCTREQMHKSREFLLEWNMVSLS